MVIWKKRARRGLPTLLVLVLVGMMLIVASCGDKEATTTTAGGPATTAGPETTTGPAPTTGDTTPPSGGEDIERVVVAVSL